MPGKKSIKPPRTGRLQLLTRSSHALSEEEVDYAKKFFTELDTQHTGSIEFAELPTLLRNMRIVVSRETFAVYLQLVYGIAPSEMEKKLTWKDFLKVYTAMMCSQPQLYRINLVTPNTKVDYVALIKANRADAQAIFDEFDYEKQGVVEKTQMPTLLQCAGCTDMHGDQFASLLDPLPVLSI